MELVDVDAERHALHETGLQPVDVVERGGSDDLSRDFVGDAEYYVAAALVGECGTVLNEEIEVETILRLFALEVFVLGGSEPVV
jgi:hypothetical protein